MKIHLRRKVLPAIAITSLVVVTAIWATMNKHYSIKNAVPSGRQHATEVVQAAPDGKVENASADNFMEMHVKMRGYCYAASQVDDTDALGGFGKSDNAPREVNAASQGKGLFLLAQPGVLTQFADKPGMRMVLVNQTNDLVAFPATDSRLNIIQEAQDEDGSWRAIEYLPSSWCGNSYHRVCLAPNHYWEFAAPRYQGALTTKLRFSIELADGSKTYSNVFDGSVNPEQFTTEEGHNATNIMDSYND